MNIEFFPSISVEFPCEFPIYNTESSDFFIIIPGYNASPWVKRCIRTIKNQTYSNFKALFIDDASTDGMFEIAKNEIDGDPRFFIHRNTENKKALYNIVHGFKSLNAKNSPEAILMIIDADDKLASPRVLEKVKKIYNEKKLLFSYGNHIHDPGGAISNCKDFPEEILDKNDYRKCHFTTSHLRTFKSKIWHKVKEQDLVDPRTGKFFSSAWDVSFCLPMCEMAGKERIMFIKDILYIYTRNNPISDDVIRGQEQGEIDRFIRTLPKYDLLPKDF